MLKFSKELRKNVGKNGSKELDNNVCKESSTGLQKIICIKGKEKLCKGVGKKVARRKERK